MDIQEWKGLSFEDARFTLKKWREEHARRSEETVEIWEHVLSRYSSALKDELWAILEQVTIAALDSARHDLAIDCIQILDKKFPNSTRVTKIQAMRLESLGNYDDANYLYDKLLEADETNAVFRKRKIAILIAKGERYNAIRELNEYLTTFINDTEAWLQLGELFLQESDFSRAAFCFEELLLSSPQNPTFLSRLAEIRYSLGGTENIEISRVYYEKSAKLAPNANALYGIILVSNLKVSDYSSAVFSLEYNPEGAFFRALFKACNYLLPKAASQKKKEIANSAKSAVDQLAELHESQNGENPTTERQISVLNKMKDFFKSGSFL